jgi:hypothetical protein
MGRWRGKGSQEGGEGERTEEDGAGVAVGEEQTEESTVGMMGSGL